MSLVLVAGVLTPHSQSICLSICLFFCRCSNTSFSIYMSINLFLVAGVLTPHSQSICLSFCSCCRCSNNPFSIYMFINLFLVAGALTPLFQSICLSICFLLLMFKHPIFNLYIYQFFSCCRCSKTPFSIYMFIILVLVAGVLTPHFQYICLSICFLLQVV